MDYTDNLAQSFLIGLVFCSVLSDVYIGVHSIFNNEDLKKKINYYQDVVSAVSSFSLNKYEENDDGSIYIENNVNKNKDKNQFKEKIKIEKENKDVHFQQEIIKEEFKNNNIENVLNALENDNDNDNENVLNALENENENYESKLLINKNDNNKNDEESSLNNLLVQKNIVKDDNIILVENLNKKTKENKNIIEEVTFNTTEEELKKIKKLEKKREKEKNKEKEKNMINENITIQKSRKKSEHKI